MIDRKTENGRGKLPGIDERMEEILRIKYLYETNIFLRSGVIGVGVGLMLNEHGEHTTELGIIIYCESTNPDPSHFPTILDGIKVQVRIVNAALPTAAEKNQLNAPSVNPREDIFKTLIGGISAGPNFFYIDSRQGTIGMIVKDKYTKKLFIMSTCRAIGGKRPQSGDEVSQPARKWVGYQAAELQRFLFGNILCYGKQYFQDVAVALPINDRSAELGRIYDVDRAILEFTDPYPGQRVMKSGVATSITTGVVDAVYVDYMTPKRKILYSMFTIRTSATAFSEIGDRGSAIFSIDNEEYSYVGLLNGQRGELAMCSPIAPILKRIKCDIV